MRPPLISRGLTAVALVALLAGCSSSSNTSSSSSSSSSSGATSGTIKIGIDLPVSGADASTGIPTQNGGVLAIEEANAAGFGGGKFKLEASLLDDAVQGAHDPAAGAQNVKTFISDGAVLGMMGPFNSSVAQSEIPLTNDAGLPQISPSNTSDSLTVGDDAKKLRVAHPDTNAYFRVCARDAKQGAGLALAAQQLGFKRAYIIDDNETYGKGLADIFEARFKASGGTVLGHDHLTKNQQDFKAVLTKARTGNPDVIFYGGTTSTGGGLVRRQMADVGLKATAYLGGDGISDQEFISVAGATANGAYYTVAAPDPSQIPSAKPFVQAYQARFKTAVGAYSAPGYAATKVLIAAIDKAIKDDGGKMPTRADVLKNVAATKDVATPIGAVTFDANGDLTTPVISLYQIKNGKQVFAKTLTVKD